MKRKNVPYRAEKRRAQGKAAGIWRSWRPKGTQTMMNMKDMKSKFSRTIQHFLKHILLQLHNLHVLHGGYFFPLEDH